MGNLKNGQRVTLSAPGQGEVLAEVLHTVTPAELPELDTLDLSRDLAEIPGFRDRSAAHAVRSILEEWKVERLAFLTYNRDRYVFAALQIGGNWYDMQRQQLTIRGLN